MPITIPDNQLRTMAWQIDELAVQLDRERVADKTSVWFLQGTLYCLAVEALGLDGAEDIMKRSHAIAHRRRIQDERMERARQALERAGLGRRRRYPRGNFV